MCHNNYSINGEINNKNAVKKDSFKYDILDAVMALAKDSLLYETFGFYVSYIYLCIYKI